MLDITPLGASGTVTSGGVQAQFELLLPNLPAEHQIDVLVLHGYDRFNPDVAPRRFTLTDSGDGRRSLDVAIASQGGTSFGRPGRYLYRYQQLGAPQDGGQRPVLTQWFTDPFARITDDVGSLAAFDAPARPAFRWQATDWKVPELDTLVVYELHVEEFNRDFAGVIDRLLYLKSLGVTCLELMPVTSVKLDFGWGYGPLHYFAPAERFGGPDGLKAFVDACHREQVAVILDVVYQHVDPEFPYCRVYQDAGVPSPMINGQGRFGPMIDFSQDLGKEFIQAVSRYWLDEFCVDGLRYDEVTDLYDTPTGRYATIAYDVYNHSLTLPRFTPSGRADGGEYSRVIQVAEALGLARTVLAETYTAAAWQNDLLSGSEWWVSRTDVTDLTDVLAAKDYPQTKEVLHPDGKTAEMPQARFQYINSHDHSHLLAFAVPPPQGAVYTPLSDRDPDRERWFAVQPFVIALYMAQGIPMLWQGQEISDNWILADDNDNLPESMRGDLRIHVRRDMHWEYFYDEQGWPLLRLHRALGKLRASNPGLRSRTSWSYDGQSQPQSGLIAYGRRRRRRHRACGSQLLRQRPADHAACPVAGTYVEGIEQQLTFPGVAENDPLTIDVPPHYGCVLTL